MATSPYVMQSGSSVKVGWNGTSVGTTSTNSLIRAFTQNGTASLATGNIAQFDLDSSNPAPHSSMNGYITAGTYSGTSYYINRNSTSGENIYNYASGNGKIRWGDFKGYDHWPFDNRGRLEVVTNDPNTNIDVSIRLWSDWIFQINGIIWLPPPSQMWPSGGGVDFYGNIAAGGNGTSQSTSGANGGIRYYWSIVNQDLNNGYNVNLDILDHHTGESLAHQAQFLDAAKNSPNNVWEGQAGADFYRCPAFIITT